MVKKKSQTSLMQMNEFSTYLNHIKILLKDFKASVEPYLDQTLLISKHEQLTSIENTIKGFNQANVIVPTEYNDFRLNLIYEIKHAKDAINGYHEFIKILRSYKTYPISITHREREIHEDILISASTQVYEPEGNLIAANPNSAQSVSSGLKKKNARLKKEEITLFDIIQANIIPPGTVLLSEYGGHLCRGIVTEDGRIILKGFYKGTYPDPNSAAQSITTLSIDGWLWWHVFIDKWKRPLDDLRVIYLERML